MKTNVRSRLKSLCFVMAFLLSQACAPASRDASDARGFWTPEDPPGAAYVLDVNIDAEGEDVSVAAEGTITLTNTTSRPLSAVSCYTEALKHDPGWALQHDQHGLRINKAWVEERLKTPFTWSR